MKIGTRFVKSSQLIFHLHMYKPVNHRYALNATTLLTLPFVVLLHYVMIICILLLAPFEINIAAQSLHQVGDPLTLDCNIQDRSGITSPLEIVWTTNTLVLQRTNITPSVNDGSSVYTDSYTIMQLTTSDHGRVIQCIANRTDPPVMDGSNIILNVTGK